MKKIAICLLGIATLLCVGCEDKLDIPKHGNMGGQEDFYKTDDQATEAAANLYNSWAGQYYNWFLTLNLLSDDVLCGGGMRGDNSDMERLNEYTFGSDNSMVEGLYSGMYSLIYNANLIIDHITPDSPVKSRVYAEALFFRGWAHFYLASLFGTAPVVDHLLNPSEYRQTNSTPEQLWEQVEKDLKEAIAMNALPSKQGVNDAETGIRVTKELAKAMLGKAYVFEKKWPEAAAILDEVIESQTYDLYRGQYDMLHHGATNNNCESMLEAQRRNDTENMPFTFTYIMIGWRTEKLNIGGEAAGYIATGTYGFMNPRKGLYDAFKAAGEENSTRQLAALRSVDQMANVGITVIPGAVVAGNDGYFTWKNRLLKEDCVMDFSAFQCFQYTGDCAMRYAEVLLLAAEAHVMGGTQAKADNYVSQIRNRVGLAPVSGVTMDQIKVEKRLELCMECCRYQDLIRWGDAPAALGDQGKKIYELTSDGPRVSAENPDAGFKTKNLLLPIPLKELELNPNMSPNENW